MRSALVNDTTNVVENICVATAVTPSPYKGLIMIGLEDPIYETQTTTNTTTKPAGSTITVNENATVTIKIPDGTEEVFPKGTTVATNADGSLTVTTTISESILVSSGTACDIGWIYNSANGTFSAP